MVQEVKKAKRRLFSALVWRTRIVFWAGAITVGLVAVVFAHLTEWANHTFRAAVTEIPWLPFVVTPLGLMLVAAITRKFFPGSEGSGIPQSIAALNLKDENLKDRILSIRVAIGKVVLATLAVLCGASLGREGPTVHVGAAVMYSIRKFARFPHYDMQRGLILAGGAAGIAAAFNTPLAGIIFAVEEMYRSFEEKSSGTVLIAVIIAGITAIALQGPYTYFGSTDAAFESMTSFWVIPIVGFLGGVIGGAFAKLLIMGSSYTRPLLESHPYKLTFLCGLALAVLGIASSHTVYGTGYDEAKAIITTGTMLDPFFPVLKALATMVTYFTGIPAGIFAPSLATGAGIGANFASVFGDLPASAVIMIGMVAYFAGVVQTPITAFVIVMEMTDNRDMLLPLMATSFIAYGASRLICPQPIYRVMAENYLSALNKNK